MTATFIIDTEAKKRACAARVNALPLDGQVWEMRLKPWEPRRSGAQNNRLHLIFSEVAKATGSDVDSVKLGYKAKFLPGKEIDTVGGKFVVYPKTSKMTVKQLNAFMEAVEGHAISEIGIVIGEGNYAY